MARAEADAAHAALDAIDDEADDLDPTALDDELARDANAARERLRKKLDASQGSERAATLADLELSRSDAAQASETAQDAARRAAWERAMAAKRWDQK